ncbi:MAG: M20/M25/M40 family metallo-hydrolase [Clostridiales bacterium]|nr:M20/M25/M40 family metallo-hydrolase [Clostridiales bacterium]
MVNRQRILDTFLTLVSFDSESFSERRIKEYLRGRLDALGMHPDEDDADLCCGRRAPESAGNLYARLDGNAEGEAILFSSHMDTVKPGLGKHPVVHEDGTITSDGTTVLGADDCGGLAAILEALAVITEENLPHPTIEVLFPVAEELYGRGSDRFDYAKLAAKICYCLDLTGEIGHAVTDAPTILSVDIRIEGRSAHAGFNPEEGINALTTAAKALARIPTGRVADDTTVNFGLISGGTITNAVPGEVKIGGEVRSLRHEEALRRGEEIRHIFEEEAAALGARAEIEIREQVRAYRTPRDHRVVTRFEEAVRAEGLEPTLGMTFGGADQNHFAKHGITGIVVSSAMHDVHTVHEYTKIDELVSLAGIVLRLMTGE